jgi:uncharacterized protein YbjQ (UPF0145 family)
VSPRERDAGAEPQETPAQERQEQAELERIEAGGIPLMAERRLRELGGTGTAYTSDLSVGGFALLHELGLKPLSQVMGSSIYQVGYQGATWPMMMGGSVLTELSMLSEAWNEVRRRALNRMEIEARETGADAVVGVQTRTAAHDWAQGAIEYVVLGTAVRRAGTGAIASASAGTGATATAGAGPVMTELSVADYAKLARAGIEPLGIVAWTSVFFAAYAYNMMLEPNRYNTMQNFELAEFTAGVYGARELVMARIGEQARERGASGIVGVRVGHSVRRQEVGSANRSRGGVVITFDAIGTAVRDGTAQAQQAPKPTVDLTT